MTNLKSYGQGKRVSMTISRLEGSGASNDIEIVRLSETTGDYPMLTPDGLTFYSDYNANEIRILKKRTWNKLKKAIKKFGVEREIDGILFAKVLRIKVEISGFLSESGEQRSISGLYWLINSEE